MKKVYQTKFDDNLGDCFRACIASIFEFPIKEMPNFWEQTQDVSEFWRLNNSWLAEHKNFKFINFELSVEHKHIIDDLLCVACAKSPRGNADHAVVWQNKLIHDPHPSEAGLAEEPDTFTLFLPLDPNQSLNSTTKSRGESAKSFICLEVK